MVAILLAGGRSSRFGGDKLAYPLHRRPIVKWTYSAVRQVDPNVRVCVSRSSQSEALRTLLPKDVRFLRDLPRRAVRGPGAGIVTGLRSAPGESVLVVAADMPWIEPRALRRLLATARRHRGVAVPIHASGMIEPLVQAHAVAPSRGLLDQLVRVRAKHLRPTDLLRALPQVALVSERTLATRTRCFRSVNTRADLSARRTGAARSAGKSVLLVPPDGSRSFWKATALARHGSEVAASHRFLHEADFYGSLGARHLELDCLLDAIRHLRKGCPDRGALGRRIASLRDSIGLPGPGPTASAARRELRGSA